MTQRSGDSPYMPRGLQRWSKVGYPNGMVRHTQARDRHLIFSAGRVCQFVALFLFLYFLLNIFFFPSFSVRHVSFQVVCPQYMKL